MSDPPVKVVLIVGRGRSGSTILDNVLGGIEGFVSVGELHNLWRRAILKGRLCGCGVPLVECPVWSRIIETAHRDPVLGRLGIEDVMSWQSQVVRQRHLRRLLRLEPGRETGWEPLDRYVRLLGRVYRAIAETSGARVVVDSSKRPEHAAVVRLVPGIELHVLHLVRDPRAVAFSRRRIKAGPDGVMRQFGVLKGTRGWIARNLEASLLREAGGEVWFDLTAFARHIGQPYVHDARHRVWSFGPPPQEWERRGRTGPAPDFTLPDLDGRLRSLSDFRGTRVFLVTWASW